MEKGTRIEIVKGRKGKGVTGTVFWTGPNNYGDGERLGIQGDDGETYWVNEDYVEELDPTADDGPPPPPEVNKGDLVEWAKGEDTGIGKVFWVGESKHGGLRLGVNDEGTGEAVWVFANQVTILGTAEEAAAANADDDPEDVPF